MTMNTPHRLAPLFHATIIWLICMACGTGDGLAAGRGDCFVADVPEAFSLGEDDALLTGSLKICLTERYTPVRDLHATFVDGHPVGRLLSRRSEAEGRAESHHPFVVFDRGGNGTLTLRALVVPEGDRMIVHRFGRRDRGFARALLQEPATQRGWVRVAANR